MTIDPSKKRTRKSPPSKSEGAAVGLIASRTAGVAVFLALLATALPLWSQQPKRSRPKNGQVKSDPSSATADWPAFRGPTGQGVAREVKPPTEWSDSESLVWKTPLPGPGASSPVTFGNRIYITCYSGYYVPGSEEGTLEELKRHLVALNADSGEILWNQSTAARLPEEGKIRDHGYAASSPAVDSERIYTFFGKSGVIAWNHQGEKLWQADVGSKTHGWGSAASPLLYHDLVIINASVESESLVALDQKTGEERWRTEGIREAWNTPIVARSESGREELIVAIQGQVLSFEPETGKPLWSCKTDIGWYMVPGCVAAEGIVYCLGGRSGVAGLAVRMGGSGDVTETHRLWTSLKGTNVSSPVYHEGHLYWVNDQREIAYCAKGETGEVVYEQRLERAGQFYASTLLADGRLYYLSRDGRMFVLSAEPEFKQLARNDLADGSIFNGSPVPFGNRLLIRSDKFLYCIGAPSAAAKKPRR